MFICPLSRVLFELRFINRFSASSRSIGNIYLSEQYRFHFNPDFAASAAVFHEKQ